MIVVVAYALFLLISTALVLGALAWYTRGVVRRIETALPPLGEFIVIDGVRLHVRDQGSGPPLLLLHGLHGQMGHFNYGAVAELADSFRVVTVDRPGAGWSGPALEPGLRAQARILAGLVERLGLERPTVVGHSLGGTVALAMALDHPQAVGALALIAPLSDPGQEAPPVFGALGIRPRALCRLFAWTLAVPATVLGGARVLQWVFGPEPVPADFQTRGGGLLSLRPSQFIGASRDMQVLPAELPQLARRYAALDVPLAVLYGRDDRLLDWGANGHDLVARVAGARLELVEGGHMLPITRPTLCAHFIREAAEARSHPAGGRLTAS